MSRHRLEAPARVRPRVGRIAAAGVSLVVTSIALLGFVGVIPIDGSGSGPDHARVVAGHTSVSSDTDGSGAAGASTSIGTATSRSQSDRSTVSHALEQVSEPGTETRASNALPEESGQGSRRGGRGREVRQPHAGDEPGATRMQPAARTTTTGGAAS